MNRAVQVWFPVGLKQSGGGRLGVKFRLLTLLGELLFTFIPGLNFDSVQTLEVF